MSGESLTTSRRKRRSVPSTPPYSEPRPTPAKNATKRNSVKRSQVKSPESNAIGLSKNIVALLANSDYQEAKTALKMAAILLPTPAARRKVQKDQETARENDNTGSLVSADEDL